MTDFLTDYGIVVALICAAAAVVYGVVITQRLLAKSPGNDRMQDISGAIQEGASAYLRSQYLIIAAVAVPLAILLWIVQGDIQPAIGFVIGGVLSGATGFIGMNLSVRANSRVAEAARDGVPPALDVAFKGGSVTGMLVVGLALLGVAGYFGILVATGSTDKEAVDALIGLGFGGSLISVFARLGGGIFTKAADVGADLVGKVEAGIPEDDPRNPATIADNVGDNVGDVAGMGADLFESYAGSIIAPISLVAFALGVTAENAGVDNIVELLAFPFAIAAVGMIASIIGAFFVRAGDSLDSKDLSRALHRGTNVAMAITVVRIMKAAATLRITTANSSPPRAPHR